MRPSIIECYAPKLLRGSKRDNMRQQENIHFPALERFVVLGSPSLSRHFEWYRAEPEISNIPISELPFSFLFLLISTSDRWKPLALSGRIDSSIASFSPQVKQKRNNDSKKKGSREGGKM